MSEVESTAYEPITDDKTWTEGDFTIISSDNVRFKAPSYQILSASKVFAAAGDMPSTSGTKLVHMTDTEIETAEVVRLFLVLATSWQASPTYEKAQLYVLAQFLVKYDCQGPIAALAAALRNNVTFYNYVGIFVISSMLDQRKLAIGMCQAIAEKSGRSDNGKGLFKMMAALTPQDMKMLSPRYQWALYQAAGAVGSGNFVSGWDALTTYLRDQEESETSAVCPLVMRIAWKATC